MPSQTYDIIFSGQLIEGASLDEAKHQIANIFKANDNQLQRLFSGKPVIIKSAVDDETATKYRIAFRKAGALIEIKQSTSSSISNNNSTNPEQLSTNKPSEGLALLPPNTGTLIDCAKKVTPQHIPDISNISLASPGTIIDESPAQEYAEIDTGNLSAAPPNSGTLEDCKKQVAPYPIPDISHLDIDDK